MYSRDFVQLFLQLSLMLAVALAFGQMALRLGLPAVAGELVGGIVLGPAIFAAIAPGWCAWLFPAAGPAAVGRETVVRLGILFFVFVAGMEMDTSRLRRRRASVIWTSVLGIVVPLGAGYLLVILLPDAWGPRAREHLAAFALFMGTALSISALPVISRILMDLDLLRREIGALIVTAAVVNDLVGWSLFEVNLGGFAASGATGRGLWVTLAVVVGGFILALTAGRLAARRLVRWLRSRPGWPHIFIGASAALALAGAAAAEAAGVHAVFGALLAGVALAPAPQTRNSAHEAVYHFAVNFFAPVYFVSIGLKVDFVRSFDLPLVLIVLAVACAGKVAGATLGAWLGGMPPREALACGFGLNARGAMEIILASVALEHDFIDERVFVALVVMALVTSIMSAPGLQLLAAPRTRELPAMGPVAGAADAARGRRR